MRFKPSKMISRKRSPFVTKALATTGSPPQPKANRWGLLYSMEYRLTCTADVMRAMTLFSKKRQVSVEAVMGY